MKGGMIMSRSFDKKSFDVMVNFVHTFLKFSIIALFVLIGILGVALLVFTFLPAEIFDYNIANLETVNIGTTNVIYALDGLELTGIYNVKWLLVLILLVANINLGFFQFITIQLKKIVKNVKEKDPFTTANAQNMKIMGIGFLIASVVVSIANSILFMSAVNTFNIFEATVNFSVDFQTLFTGILILILGYIFEYGAYLQDEHNMTV